MPSPVIEIDNIEKRFEVDGSDVTALTQFSLKVKAGRITGVVGPDGAGKTTLIRLIAGLLKPDAGRIRVLGFDSVGQSQRVQAGIGYMPQRFGLYEDLSVIENLELYADLQGLAGKERRARFERLLAFTGLEPFRTRLAGRLSGGMKQKLGLACTLVNPPLLLLLDEPSVGVDPVSRRELWQIVKELVEQGITVLWSTAYLDEAEMCDEVVLLNRGRLLETGPPGKFSEKLRGRTFAFPVDGANKRKLLHDLRRVPEIVDASIKGRDVRLLFSRSLTPNQVNEKIGAAAVSAGTIEEAEPDFEDAFVALITEQRSPETGAENRRVESGSPKQPEDSVAGAGSDTEIGGKGAVIEVEGLVRVFGDFRAVDGIDFRVSKGEIFGLLGPNGAGKSTTFKMLCGLLPPTDGKALVLGIDLRRAAAVARSRIGYMAQKFSLYGNMTVVQNMHFFASAYGLKGAERRDAVHEALVDFGLDSFAESRSGNLPLGYKQRLALAAAIMHRPGILFLDEPTAGVDPLVRREFWRRINEMASVGVTVMVTTHFMEEAEYCDRIGIIYSGKLIETGSPEELKGRHQTPDHPAPTLEEAFIDLIERREGLDQP